MSEHEMTPEDRELLEAQMAAMQQLAEANAKSADAAVEHNHQLAKARETDYRLRSLEFAIGSYQPHAHEAEDSRILERAERFWLYLVAQ